MKGFLNNMKIIKLAMRMHFYQHLWAEVVLVVTVLTVGGGNWAHCVVKVNLKAAGHRE